MDKQILRIGITGAGCPGAYFIATELKRLGFCVVGFDSDKDNVAILPLLDEFYEVPSGRDPDYMEEMTKLLDLVDVLIPCTSDELYPLSLIKHFGETKCLIAVSSPTAISTANNKLALSKMFPSISPRFLSIPHKAGKRDFFRPVNRLGYPEKRVVLKPCKGSGSRGLMIIDSKYQSAGNIKPESMTLTASEAFNRLRRISTYTEYIAQEYIDGVEYSVDCYFGKQDNIAIPRIRHKIRSGIAFDTEIDMSAKEIIRASVYAGEKIGLELFNGFQFIVDKTGYPYLIECNPRVQGSMETSHSTENNTNWLAMMINDLTGIGENLPANTENLHGIRMRRVWSGVKSKPH
jgi:carbamoyl-phosphate synthase large subunit